MLMGWCECVDTSHRHKKPCDKRVYYRSILKSSDGTETKVLWCGDCGDLYQAAREMR